MSWVREWLKKENFDMKAVGIPRHLAYAGSLVGAAMDDLKHEDLMNQHLDPRGYQKTWIYPDEKLQYLNDDPFTLMQDA